MEMSRRPPDVPDASNMAPGRRRARGIVLKTEPVDVSTC